MRVLIVGAGLFGATVARYLMDSDHVVHVIEQRDHIGGNCYDYHGDGGVLVHKYGGHIFHTNDRKIWAWVQRFAHWQPYEHRVKAWHNGRAFSFPPNRLTFEQLGLHEKDMYHPAAVELMRVLFYMGYSEKQWQMGWGDLPASIKSRVPIRYDYDDRYFTDKYQGLPVGGYTNMIKRMLDGSSVLLGTDYLKDEIYWNKQYDHVVYSGSLDAYYRHRYGTLPYRSARFEHDTMVGGSRIGCATMNYSSTDYEYTRIMEWPYFGYKGGQVSPYTIEYPEAYNGTNERLWPVPTDANRALHNRYSQLAAGVKWLHFGGRLGSYQYLNMDQAIAQGAMVAKRIMTL